MTKFSLFYDNSKSINKIFLKGELFKVPFTLKFNKDLINKADALLIESKRYKIKLKDKSTNNKSNIDGLNNLSILNSKLITKYNFKDDSLLFKSLNSQISNNKINYNGELNFNPFNLILDVNYEKIDLKKLFNSNSILFELIKTGKLFHDNLNIAVTFNSPKITNNRILNSLKLNFNAINGEINFDKSYILSNKIGLLKSDISEVALNNDGLVFNGNFNLDIKNSDHLFSFFQTSKKFRKPIKNIYFNLNYIFLENRLEINNFKIDDIKANDEVRNILNDFNRNDDQQIGNLIIFKNLVNNLFSAYLG